jgi:hypothetical protein
VRRSLAHCLNAEPLSNPDFNRQSGLCGAAAGALFRLPQRSMGRAALNHSPNGRNVPVCAPKTKTFAVANLAFVKISVGQKTTRFLRLNEPGGTAVAQFEFPENQSCD